jgi:hypothetical protein
MGLLVRTLLIWLLVLAVPAQGAAAATMAYCSPNHHGGGVAATARVEAHSERVQHDHRASHGQYGGHHDAVTPSVDAAAATADVSAPSKFVQSDSHKCTACASCCSAAAVLSTVLDVPAPALAPTIFIAVVPTVDAFVPDGPERPPRAFLA